MGGGAGEKADESPGEDSAGHRLLPDHSVPHLFNLGCSHGCRHGSVRYAHPVLWGAVSTVLHFIPFLGPVIIFSILSAVSFLTFDTWPKILLPPLFYCCLAGLEGYFITPMVLGRRLTLNPIMVFGAFLFWGWMWGIVGVFLAVPILASIKIISDEIEWLKPVGQILSSAKKEKSDDSAL